LGWQGKSGGGVMITGDRGGMGTPHGRQKKGRTRKGKNRNGGGKRKQNTKKQQGLIATERRK